MAELFNIWKLKFASEAPASLGLQVRKARDEEGMEQLIASIRAVGMVMPLVVHAHKGELYVTAGNRRLKALQQIFVNDTEKHVPAVYDSEYGGDAREIALATNVQLPQHPVDVFEVIAQFQKAMKPEEIQHRFGMTPTRYRQVMRLAGLSPVIREAWRADEIDAEAVEAFALTEDTALQEKIYVQRRKSLDFHAHSIRHQIAGARRDLGKLLTFVGLDAFAAAGGKFTEDLFGTDHVISTAADEKLLRRMTDERLTQEAEKLTADGWSWVERAEDVKNRYTYGDVYPTRGKFSAEQKAKAGCFIGVSYQGELEVTPGKVKPEERKKVEAAEKRKDSPKEDAAPAPLISESLASRLNAQFEIGFGNALEKNPRVAARALVAAFSSQRGPLRLKEGQVADDMTFAAVFHATAGRKDFSIIEMLAIVVNDAISLDWRGLPLEHEGVAEIAAELDGKTLNDAMIEAFDGEDFFKSIRTSAIAGFCHDVMGPDECLAVGKMAKTSAVEFATVNLTRIGWLPPSLRTHGYTLEKSSRAPTKTAKAKKTPAKKTSAKKTAAKKAKR